MSDANTLLNRAKAALTARDYTLAARIYKNLILEEPDNISYKMELGNIYVKAGDDDKALTIFKQIDSARRDNFDALIAMAGIYRRQKKYDESVALLEQALVTCGKDRKAWADISYNLGFTYRQMGNYDDAINCFEEVVDENPSDVLANNHLGAVYALQEKHEKAIEAYKRGLKFDPHHPILLFNIAKSYAALGEKAEALSSLEGALRARPGWTEAIEAYADLLLEENKVDEADEVVTQALQITPDDVKIHTAKGNIYNRRSIFEKAEDEYKIALDSDDSYKNALTGLADSLKNQGKVDEAVEIIEKAEGQNPGDTKIMKQSVDILITANRLDSAYERISKLREVNKNDLQTMNLLGQYYIVNDEQEKAEGCFAEIKKIDPNYNDIYFDWGARFVQKGDDKKAEPYLLAAVQKNPGNSAAMQSLGALYEKQNQFGKALQFYRKAISADSFNQRARLSSERILEGNVNLPGLDGMENDERPVDYDTLFSGGKIGGSSSEIESQDSPKEDEEGGIIPDGLPVDEEISSPASDSTPEEEIFEEEESPLAGENEGAAEDEEFDFESFGMERLAEEPETDSVESLADMLGSDPDEEFPEEPETESVEVESPESQEKEISDESLDKLEEQIKQAAELAEKASLIADSVKILNELEKNEDEREEREPEPEPEAEPADSEQPDTENLLSEDEILEAENDDDDFLEDIPDYLREDDGEIAEPEESEESGGTESESEETEDEPDSAEGIPEEEMKESEPEKTSPKIDGLALRRAIDMLPSIIAAIEDRSMIYRFRSFLSVFKTLRDMLEYLPENQRDDFMLSRNRLTLDYVISKLSGRPGLYATANALIRSGLIHESPESKASDKEGLSLVREVLANLRQLSEELEDKSLRDVLNKELDGLEKII